MAIQLLDGSDTASPYPAPNGPLLPGEVICGYIGGKAVHVWSKQQWNAQLGSYRFPIWVADPATGAKQQGEACVDALAALGAPKRIPYGLDCELLAEGDAAFVNNFADVTGKAGYACCPYDSLSRIFKFPHRRGYWVANPTGVRHLHQHPHAIGTQWAFGNLGQCPADMDLDVFRADLEIWHP